MLPKAENALGLHELPPRLLLSGALSRAFWLRTRLGPRQSLQSTSAPSRRESLRADRVSVKAAELIDAMRPKDRAALGFAVYAGLRLWRDAANR